MVGIRKNPVTSSLFVCGYFCDVNEWLEVDRHRPRRQYTPPIGRNLCRRDPHDTSAIPAFGLHRSPRPYSNGEEIGYVAMTSNESASFEHRLHTDNRMLKLKPRLITKENISTRCKINSRVERARWVPQHEGAKGHCKGRGERWERKTVLQ